MKLDISPWPAGAHRSVTGGPDVPATRGAWRRRQAARILSVRSLAEDKRRGLGWSLICTGTLWLLLLGGLCLAFKT